MCMKLHWGPCNCKPGRRTQDEDLNARGHWEWMNPRSLSPLHRVDRNEADRRQIRHYERNPDDRADGGVPWVQQGMLFRSPLQNGHHRRQAAINKGRKIRVWVRH